MRDKGLGVDWVWMNMLLLCTCRPIHGKKFVGTKDEVFGWPNGADGARPLRGENIAEQEKAREERTRELPLFSLIGFSKVLLASSLLNPIISLLFFFFLPCPVGGGGGGGE